MRKWLARLTFSVIILAAVFVWEARRAQDPTWHYIAAGMLVGLAIAGIRERHRED